MQGLVEVEEVEGVPRRQIQTHVSVWGCHIRLSTADKIQQQIAVVCVCGGGLLFHFHAHLLLLLILHVIEFCAGRVQVLIFFDGVFSSAEQVGFKRAADGPPAIPARRTVVRKAQNCRLSPRV